MDIDSLLAIQRKKYSLPIQKLSEFLYSKEIYSQMKVLLLDAPTLDYTPNIYNKSRLEILKDSYRYLPLIYNFYQNNPKYKNFHPHVLRIYNQIVSPHALPGSVHTGMFITYIDQMGTQQQKAKYLQKSKSYEIVGCYAQTEVGHGSDVKSLETTANFDLTTRQWIINTPQISAAKYWPGQLSFFANYALVFAQTIIKSKKYGVYPFLIKIKDQNQEWITGIEGGDIGPKLGFHSKQNGFMLIHNVRIPKNNLINKYVSISDSGDFKIVGDPRIGYGTMMHLRQLISCAYPKAYAIPIIIGVRYSLFRKQFLNGKKQQISIIDYQTQQDKIFSRIAEYYAINVAGNKIRQISQNNLNLIKQNKFDLLQQTHSILAFSKCYFSQIVQEGMESLRRSLGGHGASYYSGIPQILNQYVPNNTHEGQNTVMYIQTGKYLIKNYLYYLKTGKTLGESVKYVEQFVKIKQTPLDEQNFWDHDTLRIVILKSIHYILSIMVKGLKSNNEQANEDILNYTLGSRLQQLAKLHALYFVLNNFISAIYKEYTPSLKPVITKLCQLFAINQIFQLSLPILESASLTSIKFSKLSQQKEKILLQLRPYVVALIDSFGIPEKYIRSQLARGHPYNNYLDRARQCELNQGILQSAKLISNFPKVISAYRSKL